MWEQASPCNGTPTHVKSHYAYPGNDSSARVFPALGTVKLACDAELPNVI